jgi:cell division septation protein DedD
VTPPAPRERVAAVPPPAPPAPRAQNAPAQGGGYVVQLSSQRSEADAQSSFRALQAKFPNQLAGQSGIVRRADLGDKGVFYRAMVGPFASSEEASRFCSGLKAAGGQCLIQRN